MDYRTRKPWVICLEEGGKLVRVRVKGTRQWLTVTVRQIITAGAANAAAQARQERAERREQRRRERRG